MKKWKFWQREVDQAKLEKKVAKHIEKKMEGKSHDFVRKTTEKTVGGIRKVLVKKRDNYGISLCDNVMLALEHDDDEEFNLAMNLLRQHISNRG